ncbi:MAG: hypothetical protein FJ279_34700, partial [Planctomycetes bacterium]|nr:hypothetical protein [Planctomycetota bacterium]
MRTLSSIAHDMESAMIVVSDKLLHARGGSETRFLGETWFLSRLLVVALWSATCGHADALQWEMKRAQASDQKAEWTKAGYLPRWTVQPDAAGTRIEIQDDAKGDCRGFVLLGTRLTLPTPAPEGLSVSFRYQRSCGASKPDRPRAPIMAVALFPLDAWEKLSSEPTAPQSYPADVFTNDCIVANVPAAPHAERPEWHTWQSQLRLPLRSAGKTVVLALAWGCMHMGTVEHGIL